jgi:spore germination cell wall hydrolase CwlJ-like protein
MCAVAQVIRNRGKDAFKVVTAPKQFSALNRTTPARLVTKMRDTAQWSDAKRLATCLVEDSAYLRLWSVGGATHYHAKAILPRWAIGRRPVAVVGRHLFYRLDERR